jgi:hypothetical protein
MKFFMMALTAATLFSQSSFAASPKDSWSKLRADRNVIILQPHVLMQMGAFNACATDTELRSINAVKTCTAYKEVVHGNPNSEAGGYIEYVCTNYEMKDMTIEREHQEQVCTKWLPPSEASSGECREWSTVTRTYPRDFSVEVVSSVGEMYMQHLFNKNLSLPDCK